jgi:hypothetical protein
VVLGQLLWRRRRALPHRGVADVRARDTGWPARRYLRLALQREQLPAIGLEEFNDLCVTAQPVLELVASTTEIAEADRHGTLRPTEPRHPIVLEAVLRRDPRNE